MLLIHDRTLLLLDEPVAGMTDRETEETAELILDLAKDRTIVVVEHDMAFVRSLGARVTVLHEGSVLAEGSIDHVQDDPAGHRSLSRPLSNAVGRSRRSLLRREPYPAPRQPDGEEGRGDLYSRPQRRRQDQPVAGDFRAPTDPLRPHLLGGSAPQRASAARTRACGPGAGAARPRDLPAAHRAGEPDDRLRTAAARPARHPGRDFLPFPGAEGNAAPPRRRSFRRPAAAAGHRPCPRHPADAC